MPNAPYIVLYVEDEESDALFMEMAFAKENLGEHFRTVKDGRSAIEYLSGTAAGTGREPPPLPAVVLLDLNLPEVHGFDVLKWIRGHPIHKNLPVVIFSSSLREEDRAMARFLGANDFVAKPNSPALFKDVARMLKERWCGP